MNEKPLSKFRVKVPFDELIHRVYKKVNARKVSNEEAYFSMTFFPQIFVEGAITNEGESCLIEFQASSTSGSSKFLKSFSLIPIFILLLIALSDSSFSEKIWGFLIVVVFFLFLHVMIFFTSYLFCAAAESSTMKIFRKAAKKL